MQLYKDAMVFIDEAGPLKEGQSYSMFVSCIVTNDDKLNWVKGLNHHFIDDRPERRKEFLNILVNNKQKFKVVLLKYNISLGEGSKMSDYYFEIYVRYPIKELSEIVERRVEIFYDSLNDKLSREKRNEINQQLDLFLKFLKGPHVKLNLSLENTRKRVELYKKGIMIADYIASAEFASYRGKLPQDLEDMLDDLRRSYVVQKMVSLP